MRRQMYTCAIAVAALAATLTAQQPQGGTPEGAPAAPGQGAGRAGGGGQGRGGGRGGGRGLPAMLLTSSAWPDGGEIPVKYTGGMMAPSPALSWSNAPMGTVEYVLIMTDPEPAVPMGSANGN